MTEKPHLDAILIYLDSDVQLWKFSRRSQLGLYYVAQHARDNGKLVQVDNLSTNDRVVERLLRLAEEYSCCLFGFHVNHDNLWFLRRILPALKQARPELHFVLGGPEVTADPEQTMIRLPEAICGVVGDGEETFLELLSLPSRGVENLKTCPGLIINHGSEMIMTPPRKQLENLDLLSIPKCKELTLDPEYVPSPQMMAGRGCVGRCAFCYEGGQTDAGKRLRLHSLERCLAEFDYLVNEHGKNYVLILDDTFVANVPRVRKFCRELIKKYHGEAKWFCEARVDTLSRHADLLPLMVEAGLIRLQVGGESGCQRILDAYRKGTTLDQMRNVVDNASKSGLLSLFANFIVGGAFETRETFKATLDFSLELLRRAPGLITISSSFFTPYPGTPMRINPKEFGIQILDAECVTAMDDSHPFCRTEQLSKMEILELMFDFRKTIRDEMNKLSLALPDDLKKKHFAAFCDRGITTEWYEVLASQRPINNFFKSICKSGAKRFPEISNDALRYSWPFRNVELVASENSQYVVPMPHGGVRVLDKFDCLLLELTSGKLNFAEICDLVHDINPDLPRVDLEKKIKERYSYFDREYLVIWQTDYRGRLN